MNLYIYYKLDYYFNKFFFKIKNCKIEMDIKTHSIWNIVNVIIEGWINK